MIRDNYPSQLTPLQKIDWIAAQILHTNNISAALAGDPTAAFYGSNVVWVQIIILVNDASFEDACKILHSNGYEDTSMDLHDYNTLQPPDLDHNGMKALKWRLLSPKDGAAVILAPASHWCFEVTDDSTMIVDGMRLPKFSSYVHALVSLVVQRIQSSIPAGYYELQTLNVLVPQRKYPNSLSELSSADMFFLDKFFMLRRDPNRKKVVELWDSLSRRVLTVEEAVALVPIERNSGYQRKDIPVVSINVRYADGE